MARASRVLPVPGEPDHQHALRNLAAEALELGRVLEEVDDLDDFFLGLFDAGHIGKGHVDLVFAEQPRAALAERHGPAAAAAALHLAHEVHPDTDQQEHREGIDEQADQDVLTLGRSGLDLYIALSSARRSEPCCRSRGCRSRNAHPLRARP